MQEIFDCMESGVLQIGGTLRSDTLEILQRSRQDLVRGVHGV